MARIGKADREHSGHYLTAVASVTVIVAGMAWFSQNRTLAAAAAAMGLYALHLLSIRFLLDNQARQRKLLDAQWEVLQRFIGDADSDDVDEIGDLIPAMPADLEETESPAAVVAPVARPAEEEEPAAEVEPVKEGEPVEADSPVVLGEVVPPVESLGGMDHDYAMVIEEDAIELLSAIPGLQEPGTLELVEHESDEFRAPTIEVPVPRHFALGTVALVRDLLTPAEVARVLLEQRRQPGKKFGVLAVEMELLSDTQREELLLAQQEGLFTDAEMRDARHRLRQFRENAAPSMAGLD
ncbi:MAG: hypothetical protein KAJ43_03185 [Gemmatimonadetes bacterium]|nr:hypothetical protein [Gemmatimonadota bacterium]